MDGSMNTIENLLLREDGYPHTLIQEQHPTTPGELMETAVQQTPVIPKIGTVYKGGIYAGTIAGKDGAPDYHLIHAPQDYEIVDVVWETAIESAKTPINGFTDWSLPDRHEARLLAINTPEGFDIDDWYWTSTQNARNPDYAWMQDFNDGGQGYGPKSGEYRARAVRRELIIQ
jgi:hypothetical protein